MRLFRTVFLRKIYREIYTLVFLQVRPCAFFTCHCPTFEKIRFNNKLFLCRVLSNLSKKKKNARIVSAILLICMLLEIKECGQL